MSSREQQHEWVPLPSDYRNTPLGCFAQYAQHKTEYTLKLREKKLTWTGNDYTITDPSDHEIFKIKGKVLSLHGRKTMFNPAGEPILTITDKVMTLLRAFDIYPGDHSTKDESPIAHIEGHFSMTKNKLTATFNNAAHDGAPASLEIVGSFLDRKCEITSNGVSVARVHREWWNAGQWFADMSTYYLTVAPGVDIALMAAIVVCLNEKTDGTN